MFGTVTDIKRDYGFLIGDEEGVERFFHQSVVSASSSVQFGDLEPNDRVEFVPVTGEDGRGRAINVRCIAKDGDIVPGEHDGEKEGGFEEA